MGRIVFMVLAAWAGACLSIGARAQSTITFADQGPDWGQSDRDDFYTRDQGSRLMPLSWFKALRQSNGRPFLEDGLSRYGYIPNPSNPFGLPVGFSFAGSPGNEQLGLTCAACHTRQLSVGGRLLRIDGAPALADFQTFVADLDAAVGRVHDNDADFKSFAASVLGPNAPDQDVASLRKQVELWFERFHTLMKRALPSKPWGAGRVDALGMIFNRVAGLDLGPPPTFLIPENIQEANAPVRYPFLWNAPFQDHTQWAGFALNGNDLLGTARNLGEVYGVFGIFQPRKDESGDIDYLDHNSANFGGLSALEDAIKRIGPPKWPLPIDEALRERGKEIFERSTENGGCAECHAPQAGELRGVPAFDSPTFTGTFATPVQDVGTDGKQYEILAWKVKTGTLEGASFPIVANEPLKKVDCAFNVFKVVVVGSVAQHLLPLNIPLRSRRLENLVGIMSGAFDSSSGRAAAVDCTEQGAQGARYESRVMNGIWAATPYLHNGSVPSLAELLKPASERVKSFDIGPEYDKENIGLAVHQSAPRFKFQATGCDDRNSGNSNCGHEFGTSLSPDDKRALLEYLKSL